MDFLNNDDSDHGDSFKINKDYAKRYDKWRKSEELQKLKDKYGENYAEDSSTSEEEDENAVELTEDVEKDFFKTLSCLKEKNPKIYDANVKFFKEKEEKPAVKKEKTETLTMAAYQRKLLLETNGIIEEEKPRNLDDMPLVEQEKAIKESFKAALQESDDEDGGLLKAKVHTKEEQDKDNADYRQWLAGQDAAVAKTEESELKGLRDYWTNPELEDGEKFLRDFILNHKYLGKADEEGVEEFDGESEDEELEKKQEEFERKFNFRYEEPDQDFIKRYPRTVEQSMRRKDDRRIKHRDDVKSRKQLERAQKDEELKRLKALKRAEILEKIQKLQQVTGNEDMTFEDQDIEGDFSPEEHDKRMAELFNNEFYSTNADEEKPEFPDLDEELEIEKWDDWDGAQGNEPPESELHCEDPDFVMDCEYDPKAETQLQLLDSSRRRRKRRQSKFAQAVALPKPVFDPKNTSFEKYLDEYYALDYEDLIGDIPCRFKYRKVVPNDFGLSVEEILVAPDKELNRWASSKKILQRRPDHVEQYEVKAYQRKAQNLNKKMQCLPTLYTPPEDEEVDQVDTEISNAVKKIKQVMKKKKNTDSAKPLQDKPVTEKKKKKNTEETVKPLEDKPASLPVSEKKKKRKMKTSPNSETLSKKPKTVGKKKNQRPKSTDKSKTKPENAVEDFVTTISNARLKSYGLNPKKFKNKIKYGKKQ